MELFSPTFWLALLNVVFIDLILAGDDAIVIGLAARNLHPSVQKKGDSIWNWRRTFDSNFSNSCCFMVA